MSGIDVMVPSYNYGRYLRQCVESVLMQSHRDVRVLIIDDASSDGTDAVCAALAAEDPRVEVIRHAVNRGHIETYNEGIGLAERDYMLLLSADDFLLPGALARAAAVLDARQDVGLVYGKYLRYWDGDPLPEPPAEIPEVKYFEAAAFLESEARGNSVGTATAVVRTAVQKRVGGYRADLPHAGDLEMWLRFALHSRVAQIRAPQAVHRRHDANMSRGYDDVADLTQCLASFALHRDEIRDRFPDGAQLEARIQQIFATKARRRARRALARGRIRTFLQINKWRKSEALIAASKASSRSDAQRRS